jgi:hypothetical protein
MKKALAIFNLVVLIWAIPASSEMRSLTDTQLDLMTAGSIPDSHGTIVADQLVNGAETSNIRNIGVDALNVANAADTTANTATVDSSINTVVLKGDTQEHARAVSIVNGIGNKVGTGVNTHAVIDRGLGELNRSGSSPTNNHALPLLNQSNIIIQQR